MTTDNTVLSEPAPSAEVVRPGIIADQATEGTGASDQAAVSTEEQQQREASEAGRRLAERRRNQENAFTRIQRRTEQLEQQNAELMRAVLESRRQSAPQPTGPEPGSEPTRDQFNDYDEYVAAVATYRAEQAVLRRLQTVAAEAQRVQYAQRERQVIEHHAQRVDQFAAQTPDFDDVIAASGDVRLPDASSEAIKNSDQGPRMLYEIARNPQIAQHLNRLPPQGQLFYLGQMAATLRNRGPQISRAPAPGNPVGSRSGAKTDVRSMTRDEYFAHITGPNWGKKR